MSIHYKYSEDVPFCELANGYYPTTGKGKLKPLPENAEFTNDFCDDCRTKLEELQLITTEEQNNE